MRICLKLFSLLLSFMISIAALQMNFIYANAAETLFVAPGGDNGNACTDPLFPCATIQSALDKAISKDIIKVAIGTYTGNEMKVVTIKKDITLSGGWNNTFTSQNGTSIIDGENVHQGIWIYSDVTVIIEHFIVQDGYSDGLSDSFGGILNTGNLTLIDSVVRNNRCIGSCWAGGIFTFAEIWLSNRAQLSETNVRGEVGLLIGQIVL